MDTKDNNPKLWKNKIPWPQGEQHKYDHGHVLVIGGPASCTGAARLAAQAALRVGAGLVSIACSETDLHVYAAAVTSVMVKPYANEKELHALIDEPRINCIVMGPGAGVNEQTRARVTYILKTKQNCVLDADALTCFEESPKALYDALHENVVLTPHEGEFKRIFTLEGERPLRAMLAAAEAGCTVVLKGQDSIIANQEGEVVINTNAPAHLATAGSGDVLAGIIAGLMAKGMAVFGAAQAGVWIHGEAANQLGVGMISEDLEFSLPKVLAGLKK